MFTKVQNIFTTFVVEMRTFPIQVKPAANTSTVAYTTSYYKETLLGPIFVSEQGGVNSTFRIGFIPSNIPEEQRHYSFYDVEICANQTIEVSSSMSLGPNTVIKVQSSSGTISFNSTITEF